ncbi:4-(cytidine 5'-diphospho)-2-C-methyl-D-erythritol kinase [Mesorhizobium sp. CAU 1741]|uniref:4-(cytidine 5'-diphospho)-2-C-methyl-D-erythritol kinase n=1 Tax=Mesorhizobium sp. CAU 1741 TaxID=3140366 RepID=UPI00325B4648
MIQFISEHAPAKVNLALHVTGRRADGYHLLDTLVVFTEAGDRIRVRRADRDTLDISGPFSSGLESDADNLVLRARDMLRRLTGTTIPVHIALEKNLPIASGIGGGSSDAAAILRALHCLWRPDVSLDEIALESLQLGADLPMCMEARPLIARGIGDAITHVEGLPALAMVLVNPGVAVSTPAIFRALASRDNAPMPALDPRPDFAGLVGWLASTRNDLEDTAASLAPPIADTLQALRHSGAAMARMSGSGATCFGLYASLDEARRAAEVIASSEPSWYVQATNTIERVSADVAT